MWVTVKLSDLKDEPEAYKQHPHVFNGRISKRAAWPSYCTGCGLVRLKNDVTERATRLGCNYRKHPTWRKNGL